MERDANQEHNHGLVWLKTWQRRLDSLLPEGLGRVVTDSLRPLGPLAAQFLWLSQPGFALFGRSTEIAALAELLESEDDLSAPLSKLEGK